MSRSQESTDFEPKNKTKKLLRAAVPEIFVNLSLRKLSRLVEIVAFLLLALTQTRKLYIFEPVEWKTYLFKAHDSPWRTDENLRFPILHVLVKALITSEVLNSFFGRTGFEIRPSNIRNHFVPITKNNVNKIFY